jgi:hypothetical protein
MFHESAHRSLVIGHNALLGAEKIGDTGPLRPDSGLRTRVGNALQEYKPELDDFTLTQLDLLRNRAQGPL